MVVFKKYYIAFLILFCAVGLNASERKRRLSDEDAVGGGGKRCAFDTGDQYLDRSARMYEAVALGDLERAVYYLREGAGPNFTNDFLDTPPLLWAVSRNNKNLMRLLLNYGANPNLADVIGNTPLLRAVESGDRETVGILLASRALPDRKNLAGYSPLLKAFELGDEEKVNLLLESGANANEKDRDGNSLLSLVSRDGQTNLVRSFLRAGADPNLPDSKGNTPLISAVKNKHIDAIKILLEKGANPKTYEKGDEKEDSALELAMDEENVEIVKLLLKSGALPDDGDYRENLADISFALQSAIDARNLELVMMLLTAGAQPGPRFNRIGQSVLNEIITSSSPDIKLVELLLQNGFHPDSSDSLETILLMTAVDNRNIPMAQLLLKYGADPDLLDQAGRSARSIASATSNGDLKELFAELPPK